MRDYANKVAQRLTEMGYETEVKDFDKANGIVLTGIAVKVPDTCIGVNIYVNDMYEKGLSIEQAAEMAKELFEKHIEGGKVYENVAEVLTKYENVKDKLTVRLYNEKTVAEVKRSAKRYGFDDLIMVPVINLTVNENESGSIKVNERMIRSWGIDKNQLFSDAIANTKKDTKAKSMMETMAEMQGVSVKEIEELFGPVPAELDQIVVSNSSNICGAAAILGQLPILKKRFKDGFYVLPCSIHEVIVVPKRADMTDESLTQMVREVNETTVQPEEVLSDRAYAFV